MSLKKLLFPALLVGSMLALIFRAVARGAEPKTEAGEPTCNHTNYDAIDAYILEQMRRMRIPGASLTIVEGERIVHQRGFGKARPRGEAPTPQTPFFIGSLTKSFTALSVMQLVERGKVELDAPVQRYLPWFRVADAQASAQITVRHLLNQTSGLPYFSPSENTAYFDDSPDATERQVRSLATLKITHPVGAKFGYSNLNYNILGLIVEVASGETYPDYVQKHIFDPLEMRHSYTSKAKARQDNLAVGHRHWFSLPFPAPDLPVPRGALPSGQLISCAEDMAHYLIAHLNGGCYKSFNSGEDSGEDSGVQILSEMGIDELQRGAAEWKAMGLSFGSYGMGWVSQGSGKSRIVSHGGNVPDFSAFMALVPEQKKGIVLLFNADPYGLPPITEEVGTGATALLAGQQPAPIRLDFVQWIMRLLPLIPLLQVVGVFASLKTLRRWEQQPALRPSSAGAWGQQIVLPLIPNLTLVAVLVYLRSSGLICFLHLFMPDVAWIARISGGLAGVWALVRTGLVLRVMRKTA